MITIDHLALKTTDLLATYRFYHEQLGLAADYNLEVGFGSKAPTRFGSSSFRPIPRPILRP